MAEIISYEALREIQRNEKRSERLYALRDDFYESVKAYLSRKNAEDDFSITELRNAKSIIQDIKDRREKKIINQALHTARSLEKADLKPMTSKERELFNALLDVLKNYRIDVNIENSSSIKKAEETTEIAEGQKEFPVDETTTYIKVRILDDLPEIIGSDMKSYGPFKSGDIVSMPEINANIFIERGKAEIITEYLHENPKKNQSVL